MWTGVSVLALVQAVSEWFLDTLSPVSQTDPVLAGLSVVTIVHFISIAMEGLRRG